MATNPETLEPGGESLEPNPDQNAPPGPVDGGVGEGGDDEGGDDPYAPLAQRMGWVPKEQFSGPPELWKPAEQFILDGRDIQRETAREVKSLRGQLETVARTSASIVQQQIEERLAKLTTRYDELVDEGKGAEAFKVAEQITALKETPITAQPAGPVPETQDFAERNAHWFNKPGHEDATSRAVEICANLAAQGYRDYGQQLRITEQRMRKEYPELFKGQMNGQKPPPGVHQPGSRASGPSNRAKGFSDMPKAAQDVANDMVNRGVIPNVEAYTKNYWLNAKDKA